MNKWMSCAVLLVVGLFAHAPEVAAQAYHGWTRITNAASTAFHGPAGGQCIDVPRASKTVRTLVAMHACHDGANQRFRLKDNAHAASRIAVYEGADERCLAYGATQEGFATVYIERCDLAPAWRITATSIRPVANPNACLAIEPVYGFLTADHCKNRDWNWFGTNWGVSQLQRIGGPRPLISDGNARCIAVAGGSTSPGASLVHEACGGAARQWFQFYRPEGVPADMVMVGVYSGAQQLCLANVLHKKIDAAEAVACDAADPHQLFGTVLPRSNVPTPTTLVNWETRRCLDAYGNGYVGTQPCRAVRNQAWR